MKATSKI